MSPWIQACTSLGLRSWCRYNQDKQAFVQSHDSPERDALAGVTKRDFQAPDTVVPTGPTYAPPVESSFVRDLPLPVSLLRCLSSPADTRTISTTSAAPTRKYINITSSASSAHSHSASIAAWPSAILAETAAVVAEGMFSARVSSCMITWSTLLGWWPTRLLYGRRTRERND